MAPPCSSIQFLDTALSCTSPFALSYTDLNQKWVIRKHLISLVQDHPDFTLSTDTFNHNDGSTVNLLNASGYLRVSKITPPIHVTIWLHENYPHMPPIVFINTSSNTLNQIHQNHPFVDQCGLTTSPYLQTWLHPGCNLCNLVHNLIKIFSHDHPFSYSSSVSTTSFTHPSLVSKREALDRLLGMLHYDKAALQAKAEEDIEGLSILQVELEKRAGVKEIHEILRKTRMKNEVTRRKQ
ncbi:hypothetical protein Dsin_024968 [Dipteronia sinensis]|uniref:UEV domain-containing protein n=1 Tax=Dipteronia sinensis TaxID=43782 RepID=A0AAD9ZWD1_9ROSI|nr:hypothetical protein Dsin_024968 [Dipteronia sinensis]